MVNVTTNIEHWYDMNEPDSERDKDDLIQSIETIATVGNYTTEEEQGQLLVSGWGNETLKLSGEKSKARFLHYVRQGKVIDDIELDFQRAMENSKS